MALPLSKTFVAANGTDVAVNDSDFTAVLNTMEIFNNAYHMAGSGAGSYRINSETFDDEQFSEGIIANLISGNFVGMSVRNQSGASTYYALNCNSAGGSDTFLVEVTAGSQSVLESGDGDDWVATDVIRLEIEGTTLTPLRNGSTPAALSATTEDSSITSGDAGIAGFGDNTGSRISSAEFGNLVTVTGEPLSAFYSLPQRSVKTRHV